MCQTSWELISYTVLAIYVPYCGSEFSGYRVDALLQVKALFRQQFRDSLAACFTGLACSLLPLILPLIPPSFLPQCKLIPRLSLFRHSATFDKFNQPRPSANGSSRARSPSDDIPDFQD